MSPTLSPLSCVPGKPHPPAQVWLFFPEALGRLGNPSQSALQALQPHQSRAVRQGERVTGTASCVTDDKDLPSVPPLELSVPADYPAQSPLWINRQWQYGR